MDFLSFLGRENVDRDGAIEDSRKRLEVVRKRLENLSFIENEDVAKVSDETVQLLLDFLISWSHGIVRGCESDYQKRHMAKIQNTIQSLQDILKPPNTRTETTRAPTNDASRTPTPSSVDIMERALQGIMKLQISSEFVKDQPRIHRQGTPRSNMSPAPLLCHVSDVSKKKSEDLEREIEELKAEIDKFKAEIFAIKENKDFIVRELEAAMRECDNSFKKLERLDSECNEQKKALELKDSTIQSLQTKNSELLDRQEHLQLTYKKLQEEMKPLKANNDYIMANYDVLDKKYKKVLDALYNHEELQQSYEGSKKAIIDLTE